MSVSAAHAAMVQAIKASGAIVRLEPDEFQSLIGKADAPLVVVARSKFFGERHEYLFGYKGLMFYTKSRTPLMLPGRAEIISARTIWIPG